MTIDYKNTVFLPKTEFPMRGDLPTREPERLKKWQDMNLFDSMMDARKNAEEWTYHWGPPYANGNAHIGHCFSKTLKDIVVRTKFMQGYNTSIIPGWDCHGLPIEWKIEEQYRTKKLNKDDVDVLTFRQECRDYAQTWADIQADDFARIGVNANWQNPYMTMHKKSEAIIAREIHKFLMNGLLYKGVKPVMWSVVEKTALAEAEIEYKEHKSITCHVAFPVISSPISTIKNARVVIWTTTPWTLPSNRAIAYGDDIDYSLIKVTEAAADSKVKMGDEFLIATKLIADVCTAAKITAHNVVQNFKGTELAGTICAHPLRGQGYEFDVRLLCGEFVTSDTGTGFVHIAGGHGEDDFNLSKANGVEITDNLTDDGKYREHVPLFAGLAVYTDKGEMGDGNFAVLKALDASGGLIAKGSLRHEYPHSWRSKAPLIFRTTPQWFIAMDKDFKPTEGDFKDQSVTLRHVALHEIAKTKWIPAQGENRIRAMIQNRPDWCISRQRTWGVPIALFIDERNGEPLKDTAVNDRIFEIFETEGSDAWFSRPASDFLGTDYNADNYKQVFDIVDVWFESGCTHSFVFPDKEETIDNWQTDLYLEGSDQHRGWFHSSLLHSCGTRGIAPYKSVLTHGFVLDEKGYKMSKSLGNVIDPKNILKDYGADILRLWAITSDYSEDVKIGKDTMKNASDLYRRLRNTLRYLLGALDGFDEAEKLDLTNEDVYDKIPELEKIILGEMVALKDKLNTYVNLHDYRSYADDLYDFCNHTLSSLYFDPRKDRLYCDRPDSDERRACRSVMAIIFEFLVTHLAPILLFTTDEAWENRPATIGKNIPSVHLTKFYPDDINNDRHIWERSSQTNHNSFATFVNQRGIIFNAIEDARNNGTIKSPLDGKITIIFEEKYKNAVEKIEWDDVMGVSQCEIKFSITENPDFKNFGIINITVEKAIGTKCERCWKILPESEMDKDIPTLSKRDADAVRYYLNQQKAA